MLLKLEEICNSCNTQFIVAFKKEDLNGVIYCPFCTNPIDVESEETNDEGDE